MYYKDQKLKHKKTSLTFRLEIKLALSRLPSGQENGLNFSSSAVATYRTPRLCLFCGGSIIQLFNSYTGGLVTLLNYLSTYGSGISGEFGRAIVRILTRRSRVEIPMARTNEPGTPSKRAQKGVIRYLRDPNSAK